MRSISGKQTKDVMTRFFEVIKRFGRIIGIAWHSDYKGIQTHWVLGPRLGKKRQNVKRCDK